MNYYWIGFAAGFVTACSVLLVTWIILITMMEKEQ